MIFSEELIMELMGITAYVGRKDLTGILSDALNEMRNPPAPPKRTANRTGVVQVDIETGAEIARYATIKEANIAIGKKEKASGISDALNRSGTHIAYGYKWYHIDTWEQM